MRTRAEAAAKSGGWLLSSSEKPLQEPAQRPGSSGWKLERIFLRQNNTFVFTSLRFGGGKGSQSQPPEEAQGHVCSGQARLAGFLLSLPARLQGTVTLGGFQHGVFNSVNCSQRSLDMKEALSLPSSCPGTLAINVPRAPGQIYGWSQKSGGGKVRTSSSS